MWLVSFNKSGFIVMNRKGSDNYDIDCTFIAIGD